jgi:hypothetical protein
MHRAIYARCPINHAIGLNLRCHEWLSRLKDRKMRVLDLIIELKGVLREPKYDPHVNKKEILR